MTFDGIREDVLSRIERTLREIGSSEDRFPFLAEGERWQSVEAAEWINSPGNWTGGFWPGVLWTAYRWTGETRYAEAAGRCCRALKPRLAWRFHDLGFLFRPSCALGYESTGDARLRNWALEAAEGMLELHQPESGLLALAPPRDGVFHAAVDTMANLELLVWAYRTTERREFLDIATAHAAATARILIREDGSTYHIARFRQGRPQPEWRGTWQGVSDGSCWSRGQAWALAGYSLLGTTAEPAAGLRETLARVARFWHRSVPDGALPAWDLSSPGPAEPRDSSAGAIAARALLTSGDADLRETGRQLLGTLAGEALLPPESPKAGILDRACFHLPKSMGREARTIWGDYYFTRALEAVE